MPTTPKSRSEWYKVDGVVGQFRKPPRKRKPKPHLGWTALSDGILVAQFRTSVWVVSPDKMAGRKNRYSLISTYSYGRESRTDGRELTLAHCKKIANAQFRLRLQALWRDD